MDNTAMQEFTTMDIYFAAYLVGKKKLDYELRAGDRGKVMFVFQISRTDGFAYMKEFHSSGELFDFVQEVKYLRGQMNESRGQTIHRDPSNY
jgi:hypothetical protein